jgi:hypothetical protein
MSLLFLLLLFLVDALLDSGGLHPVVFVTHGAMILLGSALGTIPSSASTPCLNQDFYLTPGTLPPGSFPAVHALLGPSPALPVSGALTPGLFILCLAHVCLEIHFPPSQGFDHDAMDLHWSPKTSAWLTLVLFLQGLPLLAFLPQTCLSCLKICICF